MGHTHNHTNTASSGQHMVFWVVNANSGNPKYFKELYFLKSK
jgi:hypothetical protein